MTLSKTTRHISALCALVVFVCLFLAAQTPHVYAASASGRMDMIGLLNADRNLGEKAPISPEPMTPGGATKEARFPTITSIHITRSDGVVPMVWMFGGIVAQAVGTGFQPGITLYVEGSSYSVKPLPNTLTSTSFLFIIPPLDSVKPQDPTFATAWQALCTEGSIAQRVTVAMDAFPTRSTWLDAAIRYYLWERTSNTATTAFLVDATPGMPGEIRFQTPGNTKFGEGTLSLPVPTVYAGSILAVYGLVRLTDGEGSSIHLYSTMDKDSNTIGSCVYDEITAQVSYARAKGTPTATLQLSASPRSIKETARAISVWSRPAQLPDYGVGKELEELSVTPYRYQSTLTGNDTALLNELGAFVLRKGADLSEVLAPNGNKGGLTLVTDRGANLSTLARITKGDTLRIRSVNGGLGYGVTVVAQYNQADVNAPELAIAPLMDTSSEEEVAFSIPSFKGKGTVHIALYAIPLSDNAKLEGTIPLVVFPETLAYVSDEKTSPCFIATAAYGTPLAAEISVLRSLRDRCLLSSAAGTALVDAYYRVSPPVADWIATQSLMATLVRGILWLVIACAQAPGLCGMILFGFLFAWRTTRRTTLHAFTLDRGGFIR